MTPVIARCFERTVYHHYSKKVFEENLTVTQYAYREGCSCTDVLIQIEYNYLKALDDKDCNYLRLFAMDFSKAFDNVKHSLVGEKLKALYLNPYVVDWYLSFLMDRKQRLIFKGVIYKWHNVNKGTSQGSVRGSHLFNLFIDDLAIRDNDLSSIVKSADDTTLLVKVCKNETDLSQKVVNQFFSWTQDNAMACNPKKCKELILCKKVAHDIDPVNNITQVSCLKVLGVTLQSNHRVNEQLRLSCRKPVSVFM